MISDFSGIIFDYAFLFGKSVFYTNAEMDLRHYDAYDLENDGKIFGSSAYSVNLELNCKKAIFQKLQKS